MEDLGIDAFVQWFQSNGGYIDTKSIAITQFSDSGRGAIALIDIPEGSTLFTLPRTMTLSTRTSPLPRLFGTKSWRAHGLHRGWVGLILCMMWEDAWAHELDATEAGERDQSLVRAKWGPYMRTLPTIFDTPMFWSGEELKELQGTSVMGKIGHDDVERTYFEQLSPAIKTSPTLFPPSHHGKWYSLDAYHRAGSRILSRSFTVSRWTNDGDGDVEEDKSHDGEAGGSDADETQDHDLNISMESSMHIDDPHPSFLEDSNEGAHSDSEDDDDDDPSDVAMVPMADILNARWGSENAKLFYEPYELRMVATKNIKQGEQIFNTYGDPPNSDLLRRYGHVDLIRLPPSPSVSTPDGQNDVEMKSEAGVENISHLGNPSDIVEMRADLIVRVVGMTKFGPKEKDVHERIEWWLDEGEDDTFVLSFSETSSELSTILPPALISLTRLLILPESDFKSTRSKGKLPKGKLRKGDAKDSKDVLEILDEVIKQREGMYAGGSVEDDERLLSFPEILPRRQRHAVIVRLGEKRILRHARQAVMFMLAEPGITRGAGCGSETYNMRTEAKPRDTEKEGRKHATTRVERDHGGKRARKR